jgi:hypothetical protein
MSKSSGKLKYQIVLEEFLKAREWEDELSIDKENKKVALVTGVTIGEHSGKLIIEASDESDLVSVYFYLGFDCKKSKRTEMCILLNDFNARGGNGGYGCFQLLDPEDDRIRWVHRVDFEGSSPTGKSVERIVGPAWERVSAFIETICAVALTKQSAAEAIEEFDSAASGESEAPIEL